MKGENKRRRLQAERRTNRRAWLQVLLAGTIGPGLLAWMALSLPQIGSPKDMVKSQIVRSQSSRLPLRQAAGLAPPGSASPAPGLPEARGGNDLPEVVSANGREYLSISFAELSSFPFIVTPDIADATADPHLASIRTREQVPDAVKSLGERPVAITGFMLPIQMTGGRTRNFMLLRNQSACCYGIAPRVSEWIIVHTTGKGKGLRPILDAPVTALGTFHVGDVREEGQLLGIYQLDCEQLLTKQ